MADSIMRLWVGYPESTRIDTQTRQFRYKLGDAEFTEPESFDKTVPGRWIRGIPNNTQVVGELRNVDAAGNPGDPMVFSTLVADTEGPLADDGGFTFNVEEDLGDPTT